MAPIKPTEWSDYGYEIFLTADGSPSLRSQDQLSEPMHHQAGALSETLHIYGRVIEPIFLRIEKPTFFSLGLGLGYNEILIAAWSVKLNQADWSCLSFEKDKNLKTLFTHWLQSKDELMNTDQTYENLAEKICESLDVDPVVVKNILLDKVQNKELHLLPELTETSALQNNTNKKCHAFLWDAYSKKVSPELWQEDFLNNIFETYASDEYCGFSSYAAVGALKRALIKNKFEPTEVTGFSGKRNSTLAWRR